MTYRIICVKTHHHHLTTTSGEFYLGYSRQELLDVSWYQLLHWDFMREAQSKHRLSTIQIPLSLFFLKSFLFFVVCSTVPIPLLLSVFY